MVIGLTLLMKIKARAGQTIFLLVTLQSGRHSISTPYIFQTLTTGQFKGG